MPCNVDNVKPADPNSPEPTKPNRLFSKIVWRRIGWRALFVPVVLLLLGIIGWNMLTTAAS